MIFNILFFTLPAVNPQLICELSDCSLPAVQPAHENCTEAHFVNVNLMPVFEDDQRSSPHRLGRGSLLDVTTAAAAGDNSDPDCVTLLSEFVIQKDPAREHKWEVGPVCNGKGFFMYHLNLKLIRDGNRLKCFKFYYNDTEQCKAVRKDRLRIRVDGRGMEVENFDQNGKSIARMEFVDRNRSLEQNLEKCNCERFDTLANRYVFCEEVKNSTNNIVTYGIVAGFVLTILAVALIYSCLDKKMQ